MVVKPSGNPFVDDVPAIIHAFKECGHNGRVLFLNETYHISTVMNTTGLKNCEVDLRGSLLVGFRTTEYIPTINYEGSGEQVSHIG
jgi:hypothetical protein